ncbi:MAG: YicC family protein [Deltaproteobacteria bacterium]|nr:YicC family protein [Deltaproteobacteria bacterium]
MIKSMTGYGRASSASTMGEITIEIKSVNHRFRDISAKLPPKLAFLDSQIRKEIEKVVMRGKVDTFISFDKKGEALALEVNLPLAREYYRAISSLKEELAVESNITLSELASVKDIIKSSDVPVDEASVKNLLFPVLSQALASLDEMRLKEGETLKRDLLDRLSAIGSLSGEIEAGQPEQTRLYADKLIKRIGELSEGIEIDESRITQEVAIMAEKSDVTEEVVRLDSHLKQFRELLDSGESIGRKLDFLIQEMNREVNTIGSKSNDAGISRKVVEMKAEIEKIREQVQNIE